MDWADARGATATAVRSAAHSDDAKHRVDESSFRAPRRVPRVLVAGLAGMLLLVGGGAVAVSLTGSDPADGSSAPARRDPASPDRAAGTGLPLVPVTTDVTYRATTSCTRKSQLVVGDCTGAPTMVTSLACPGGTCTIGFWVAPDVMGGTEGVRFTFQAGAPSVSFQGEIADETGGKCSPQPVAATGTRGADGSYTITFDTTYRAGNGDGTCDSSPGSWQLALTAP